LDPSDAGEIGGDRHQCAVAGVDRRQAGARAVGARRIEQVRRGQGDVVIEDDDVVAAGGDAARRCDVEVGGDDRLAQRSVDAVGGEDRGAGGGRGGRQRGQDQREDAASDGHGEPLEVSAADRAPGGALPPTSPPVPVAAGTRPDDAREVAGDGTRSARAAAMKPVAPRMSEN
jgi:hypothetical protein